MDGRLVGWMDAWIDDGWMHGEAWMHGQMDGWTDEVERMGSDGMVWERMI